MKRKLAASLVALVLTGVTAAEAGALKPKLTLVDAPNGKHCVFGMNTMQDGQKKTVDAGHVIITYTCVNGELMVTLNPPKRSD